MKAMKKIIASISAFTVLATASAITASAITVSATDDRTLNGATVTGILDVTSSEATAKTGINRGPATVNVYVTATYFKKATTNVESVSAANGGNGGSTSATISNNGGTWIDIVSTHSANYGGGSVSFDIEW